MRNLKRTLALFLLSIAFGGAALGQSAGEPSGQLTTEQRMLPFALGMSLSVLFEIHDDNHFAVVKTIGGQIRYYKTELEPVLNLKPTTSELVRRDVVLTAVNALRAKSNRSDKWKMLAGEYFGNIFARLKKQASGESMNVDDMRFDIEMIGALANNAPDDVPENLRDKFREFGKLKDLRDFTSAASVKRISDSVTDILDTITD